MAHVLLLSLMFPPDGVSTGQLLGEIALDFRDAGHTVSVITTVPHYNQDDAAEVAQPLERRFASVVAYSRFHGIPVQHVVIPRKSGRASIRAVQWLWFHLVSTILGLRARPRPDVIVATSPPLTIGLSAWIIGVFGRIPFVYNVWELYPDVAIQLGYLKNRTLIRLLHRLERFTYRRSAAVTAASALMAEDIRQRVKPEKVVIVPNFVDVDFVKAVGKENRFAEAHGLADKFVVTYAGNMGTPQQLGDVLHAAAAVQHRPNIQLLLVGGGSERLRLEELADNLGLQNCTILPHQSYSDVPDIYGSSDACLVPLNEHLNSVALPSKVYKIMAAERTVIAVTNGGSALADLVRRSGCGVVVPPGKPDELAEVFSSLAGDPRALQRYGKAGRAYVIENFSRSVVSKQYLDLLSAIALVRSNDSRTGPS